MTLFIQGVASPVLRFILILMKSKMDVEEEAEGQSGSDELGGTLLLEKVDEKFDEISPLKVHECTL